MDQALTHLHACTHARTNPHKYNCMGWSPHLFISGALNLIDCRTAPQGGAVERTAHTFCPQHLSHCRHHFKGYIVMMKILIRATLHYLHSPKQ